MLPDYCHHSEARPNLVSFGGVVKGESAMKTEEEIGSAINYTFKVGSANRAVSLMCSLDELITLQINSSKHPNISLQYFKYQHRLVLDI